MKSFILVTLLVGVYASPLNVSTKTSDVLNTSQLPTSLTSEPAIIQQPVVVHELSVENNTRKSEKQSTLQVTTTR